MEFAATTMDAIADRRVSSLTAIVRAELERLIVSGDLPAGQRLNEQQLAARFGVSRGPVREALRSLEHAGLVTSVVNLGMFVRQVGVAEASEIYDIARRRVRLRLLQAGGNRNGPAETRSAGAGR